MNFSTIALSKGYFFVENTTKPEIVDSVEFIKSLEKLTPEVIDIQAEVMKYGYMFDAESLCALINMPAEDLLKYSKSLSEYLGDTYGDGHFVSLFGNFPANVLMLSEEEIFVHQIFHYLSGGAYVPAEFLSDETDIVLSKEHFGTCLRDSYKLIKFADAETLAGICKNICNAQQSLTSYDKEVVVYFCKNYESLGLPMDSFFPEEIPFKETLCLVASELEEYPLATATDVLRLAVYMSGGDVSLPPVPKTIDYGWRVRTATSVDKAPYNFKRFKRAERRLILSKLETILATKKAENVYADMKKYANKWIRLGEVIHPGEYTNAYPETARAFYMIRDMKKYIETYNSRVNAARKIDYKEWIKVLAERPGEFARSIDAVLRKNLDNSAEIIAAFTNSLSGVSMKVLYELIKYYHVRNRIPEKRVVIIKSNNRGPQRIKDLEALPEEVRTTILNAVVDELGKRFLAKGPMENRYVFEKGIENITLPVNMRSMNIMPGQLPRGSKIPISNNTGLLRLYCRWEDPNGQYDLDLSCSLYKADYTLDSIVSWNRDSKRRTSTNRYGANVLFSGDVRHRVGNCAEYIDIDVESLKKDKVRYIVANVHDFDGQGFEKKNSWGGVMELEEFGKIDNTWAPSSINCGFKLKSKCTNILMTIVDLKKMVMYVVDEDTAGIPVASSATGAYAEVINRYVRSATFFNTLSLMEFNVKSRNGQYTTMESAEFAEAKDGIERSLTYLKKLREEYKELRDKYINGENQNPVYTADRLIAIIDRRISELEKIKFISYADMAADYTSIFEWMF